ncbi:hypothetical protein HRbin39_00349 [bacterium HR39]|nr:hypothetical protein HRbin39_00349 [bacterium HR39]
MRFRVQPESIEVASASAGVPLELPSGLPVAVEAGGGLVVRARRTRLGAGPDAMRTFVPDPECEPEIGADLVLVATGRAVQPPPRGRAAGSPRTPATAHVRPALVGGTPLPFVLTLLQLAGPRMGLDVPRIF